MKNIFKKTGLMVLLFLIPFFAFADLSNSQLSILNADMQSNPDVTDMIATEDDIGLSNYYSTETSNKGWVTNFTLRSLFEVIDWQETIARTEAERNTLQFMFSLGQVDAGQANVRQGLADIYSGGAARTIAQRAALIGAAQRLVNRVERLLNNGLSGGVYTLDYEGVLSTRDAANARRYQP